MIIAGSDNARLYCGDCLEIIPRLSKIAPAIDHVLSDPPYDEIMQKNFARFDQTAKRGLDRAELKFASIDETREPVARALVEAAAGWVILFCIAEGVASWRDALQAAGAKYKRAMIWNKSPYTPQFNGQGPAIAFECMVAAWAGKGFSRWNGGGLAGTFQAAPVKGGDHPTQKPLALMAELIRLFTDPGQLVLDPFMGSGTTGVACVKLGRRFIGIEKDPEYFEIAARRTAEAKEDLFVARRPVQEKLFGGAA